MASPATTGATRTRSITGAMTAPVAEKLPNVEAKRVPVSCNRSDPIQPVPDFRDRRTHRRSRASVLGQSRADCRPVFPVPIAVESSQKSETRACCFDLRFAWCHAPVFSNRDNGRDGVLAVGFTPRPLPEFQSDAISVSPRTRLNRRTSSKQPVKSTPVAEFPLRPKFHPWMGWKSLQR